MFKHIQLVAFALCALLVIPAAAQVPAYVPTDGLVGWWPFNGNANDESGNGTDGVVNGAALTADRFSNTEQAYSFDGNDWIDVSNSSNLNLQNSFTISVWLKTDFINFNAGILGKWNNFNGVELDGQEQFAITVNDSDDNSIYALLRTDNSPNANLQIQHINSNYNDNNWKNLIFLWDGSQISLFDNNVLVDNSIAQGNMMNYLQNLEFGRYAGGQITSGGNTHFNGVLDDIGIWNRALTEQEIQNLYTGQCPSIAANCTSLPSNLQEGLVGYWPFCGNANDESGNGNDGTVNGATLTEDRFGNAESSFSFNGIDQYLNLGSFNPFISSGSINVWINESNGTEGLNYIISKFDGSSPPWPDNSISRSWMLYRHNPQYGSLMTFELSQDGEYAVDVFSDFQGVSGTWTCLTVTFELGVIKFYKNGILMSQSSAPMTSVYSSETPVLVGISAQGSGPEAAGVGGYFDGLIDDIGIWNRALTPEEVQELFTLDACTFTVYDTSYVTVYDTLTTYETVYDTLYTYETIYDTVTTYVTVTDTLLIDITFTGIEGQPSWLNTVTVFPNPASDHITIDYGNFALLAGYNTIITDAAGATVYSSAVNSQQAYIDINAWGAAGVYYLTIYDADGAPVAVRHIVLE
jgi:hypothetical protein